MTDAQGRQLDRYNGLMEYLQKEYYHPDIGAVKVVLATIAAHYYLEQKPVWLIVSGEPGTGKTDIAIALALAAAPVPDEKTGKIERSSGHTNVDILDSSSVRGLLSGFGKGGKPDPRNSFLHRLGPTGIIVIPDLTTLLSGRPEHRSETLGFLRRIHDGRVSRNAGNAGEDLIWQGKITVIAAGPPGLDSRLGDENDLGNRFLTVNWIMDGDPEKMAIRAALNIARAKEIAKQSRDLAQNLLHFREKNVQPVSMSQMEELSRIAVLASQVRRTVTRNYKGEVVSAAKSEGPTRVMQGMVQVARAHAGLLHHPEPTDEDMKVAKRLGLDTIPLARREVLDALSSEGDGTTIKDIAAVNHSPIAVVNRTISDLEALGMVEKDCAEPGAPAYVMMTEWFRKLMQRAGFK